MSPNSARARGPFVPLSIFFCSACSIADSEGAVGGKVEGRNAFSHVGAPIDVVHAVSEVVASRQHRGPRGRANGPAGVEILHEDCARGLSPFDDVRRLGGPVVVMKIGPAAKGQNQAASRFVQLEHSAFTRYRRPG